jgi:Rieske Fe-S protein
MSQQSVSRRSVVQGAALAGLGVAGLGAAAACSSSTPAASGGTTVPTAEVPVGGGKIIANPAIVVTQPTAGTYKAFSSICPHQQCPVTQVDAAGIGCACHGSVFDATTGAVRKGPATEGLPAKTVSVDGDKLTIT